jgi:hypothetical protein
MKRPDEGGDAAGEEAGPLGESGVSRWSRRKLAAQGGGPQSKYLAAAETEASAQIQQENQPGDAQMPAVESLDAESDYSGFLSPKVSDELRRLALRKLFHSASFNVCDGLDDYAEDFTNFAKLGDVVTADMRWRAEMEALKKLQQPQNQPAAADERPEGLLSAAENQQESRPTGNQESDSET